MDVNNAEMAAAVSPVEPSTSPTQPPPCVLSPSHGSHPPTHIPNRSRHHQYRHQFSSVSTNSSSSSSPSSISSYFSSSKSLASSKASSSSSHTDSSNSHTREETLLFRLWRRARKAMATIHHYIRDDKGAFMYPAAYEVGNPLEYEHRRYWTRSIFARDPVLSYDVEKGGALYPGPLPEQESYVWPKIRHGFFSAYRRLFGLIFLTNLAGLLYVVFSFSGPGRLVHLSTAVSANLLVAVLIRQDFIVNAIFAVFALTPQWFPLRIRRWVAKVYEYGGVHSGAAIAATMWYIFLTVEITRTYARAVHNGAPASHMLSLLLLTWVPLLILLLILIFTIPELRRRFHDQFEASHRFGGWLAIIIIWVQAIIMANATRGEKSLGRTLAENPSFWFLIIISACIIYPWLRLRRVIVRPQRLSQHATRLWFDTVKVGFCQGFAVSDRPLFEWHTFASLPEPDFKSCSLLVSNAGDWTKKQINQGPHKLWIRGIPRTGVLRIAPIFKSVIMVATGSGIGPQLSFLLACGNRLKCRLLWSTRSPQETYGREILDLVNKVDPQAVIIDTKKTGRPDIVQITYELYKNEEAEAVFIISNQKITRSTVYALESRGIPAYGPVFDS
ncbi:hypothetical protein AOL_s00076g157 [Orbilia oligospora ATCC 24927]|uniref:Nonribosomal peptide synthetase 12 n=1 Tax=Arthrobotrys oligospora (strain ATCC 24927 / CBS 115.81 / DSM 1491) TaxID=756982 RepID=G1X950_ARTOA|nr:hypothetical protein AOL_s00076g157 [Orbilia oligospora ATCC 24927]EGX50393.1 hypothetical protein AOL_s00076g157 [Orbilia oligospora ATCC 24927]